jgi:hypothetical protein
LNSLRPVVEAAKLFFPFRDPKLRGPQGIAVAGGLVLTCSHCIERGARNVRFRASNGDEVVGGVIFCDTVGDIAVLGVPNWLSLGDDGSAVTDKHAAWSASTSTLDLAPQQEYEDSVVYLSTRDDGWISGTMSFSPEGIGEPDYRMTWAKFDFESPPSNGDSGGPIVTEDGKLVAIFAWSGSAEFNKCEGRGPVVASSLPAWILSLATRIDST